ncbi:MAG: sugar phosphate isomerase/epimerase [Clostridia bacterium]|nr:sugar phosphate isomerase/epimerase [Clostridia bacterium]
MYQQKIGISIGDSYSIPLSEVLAIIKQVGFDAISPDWTSGEILREIAEIAGELGLELQSLHAPFSKVSAMWSRDEGVVAPVKKELFEAIDACERLWIPVMVAHVWIGFDYRFDGAALCYDHFDDLVSYAAAHNVKIAFENTEGLEYLEALMAHFEGNEAVGFCWDSGHEMCYNFSEDLLGRWGDRLLMTHVNDNLGISRFDGRIYWTDDLHLLPYDGIADWDANVARLKKARRLPILNFELNIESKPNRHENDGYAEMPLVQYFTEAYKRACRIAYRYAR